MNHLLISVLIVFSVYNLINCAISPLIPLCKIFEHEGKEVNGIINMTMGVRWMTPPFEGFVNKDDSNSDRHIRVVRPSRILSDDETVEDTIRKVLQKKHLIDQGFLIKELVDEYYLNIMLNKIDLKEEESLIFDKNVLNQYYDKQIFKLKNFQILYDDATGMRRGLTSDFE